MYEHFRISDEHESSILASFRLMAYTALPAETMTICILAAWACQWMTSLALHYRKKQQSMASVMAKIEALQAVGAEELVDQALAKVIQFEIDRLQQEQQRLKAELGHFEQSYQMTSEACQRKFDAGELGAAVEFFAWPSLYGIYQQNEHSLRLLEH